MRALRAVIKRYSRATIYKMKYNLWLLEKSAVMRILSKLREGTRNFQKLLLLYKPTALAREGSFYSERPTILNSELVKINSEYNY